jgi:hypothetical protein
VSSLIPLTNAVTSGDESAVSALLADGADLNERTSGGQTPLILAIIFGRTEMVRLLVKAGADPELRDNLGLNATDWAKRRGLTEALEILTNGSAVKPRPTTLKPAPPKPEEETVTPSTTESPRRESVTEDEKSRRWLAGLKQRLNEQELRRLNRNEPPPPPPPPPVEEEELPTLMTVSSNEKPVTVTINTTEPVVQPEPVKEAHPATVFEPPSSTSSATGKRKRCPRCNAIYSDLVSYCAHHIVRLVDADEPIFTEPPKKNPVLFWIMVIATLTGSIVVGTLVTTYLYKSNMEEARKAAAQQTQKGSPEVSAELEGKAVSLPEAECPINGPEPVSGTVVVRVMVDRKGQVYWARGSGGDWLMRGAATEAAMKSTFSPEKLRSRETEGTITYTFKP